MIRDPRERTYDLTIPSEIDAAEAWLDECQPGYEALERESGTPWGLIVGRARLQIAAARKAMANPPAGLGLSERVRSTSAREEMDDKKTISPRLRVGEAKSESGEGH